MLQDMSYENTSQEMILRTLQDQRLNHTKNLANNLGYIHDKKRRPSILPNPRERIDLDNTISWAKRIRKLVIIEGEVKRAKKIKVATRKILVAKWDFNSEFYTNVFTGSTIFMISLFATGEFLAVITHAV